MPQVEYIYRPQILLQKMQGIEDEAKTLSNRIKNALSDVVSFLNRKKIVLPKAEERQTDLRNTSIMEVILAVIIVLLLVVYTKDVEIGNLKRRLRTHYC